MPRLGSTVSKVCKTKIPGVMPSILALLMRSTEKRDNSCDLGCHPMHQAEFLILIRAKNRLLGFRRLRPWSSTPPSSARSYLSVRFLTHVRVPKTTSGRAWKPILRPAPAFLFWIDRAGCESTGGCHPRSAMPSPIPTRNVAPPSHDQSGWFPRLTAPCESATLSSRCATGGGVGRLRASAERHDFSRKGQSCRNQPQTFLRLPVRPN